MTARNLILAWVIATASLSAWADGLPDYKPRQILSGTVRSSGNDAMGPLLKLWQQGFRKYQPGIQFADDLKGTASGIYGLEMRTADMALMARPIYPFERYGTYERSWTYPVEIEVATGSLAALKKSPAFAVFVNGENPLAEITLGQLDGIYGAERGGGWKALSWDESAARTAADSLRSWGQVGLRGHWASRPIHVYGPPILGPGTITYFQARVMGGGAMWNEDLREYADRAKMLDDLRKDPLGIAVAPLAYKNDGVKVLAVAETSDGPFMLPTREALAQRNYPLSRPVYIDITIDNEKSDVANPRIDPKVKEFLRYVLSRQGQKDVEREGAYVPLPAALAQEQLRKLDDSGVPPEKLLLGE